MMTRQIIMCLLLCISLICNSQQNSVSQFESFAEKQSRLFQQAYEKKDTAGYKQLLSEFNASYQQLDKATQKIYSGYLQNGLYNLCCTYSLMNKKPLALQYLQQSINAGYYNYAHLKEDKDLDNIRAEASYKKMVAPLRSIGDYLYILKGAGRYDPNDKRSIPSFTYQSSDNVNLQALRKGFNLDSIAGEGTDVLKMINLMHWIHTLIPHDGNHANPQVKNAMSMIETCKKENRGLNCRGIATVLNECYLAMGFKSRFVTCLPKDSLKIDPDCHVINMVWSVCLNKWLWMDPTNDAYIMNEKGELLGIDEVRERIIDNKPLILNPSANWNNKVSKSKEDYIYNYMAKNLYMLQCNVNSEYDTETTANGKNFTYVSLVPVNYFDQHKEKVENIDSKFNTTYRFYQTNNPFFFWQSPMSK